ncbi:hypothetical protein EJ03DRAFT_124630 [Teratosphaeria nubilosa]|uniref:Uncharacterized protein n=1 Tax=Teratosphaeria nubilosa TaxID=161662 RepID=A0A6G1LKZ9_9PEZI|nr:hypothetical protein EJ03DRAFT_124630 [Teratosphaeria nubilosa]
MQEHSMYSSHRTGAGGSTVSCWPREADSAPHIVERHIASNGSTLPADQLVNHLSSSAITNTAHNKRMHSNCYHLFLPCSTISFLFIAILRRCTDHFFLRGTQ